MKKFNLIQKRKNPPSSKETGGADGTRTRDLPRDRRTL
jgi:hypothetical protein